MVLLFWGVRSILSMLNHGKKDTLTIKWMLARIYTCPYVLKLPWQCWAQWFSRDSGRMMLKSVAVQEKNKFSTLHTPKTFKEDPEPDVVNT